MRRPALACLLLAAACAPRPEMLQGAAMRSPGQTYACIAPELRRLPLRHEFETTPDGWRVWLQAYAGPPSGWYRKGRIEYAQGTLAYLPDSATDGIADGKVLRAIRPILRDCTRQRG